MTVIREMIKTLEGSIKKDERKLEKLQNRIIRSKRKRGDEVDISTPVLKKEIKNIEKIIEEEKRAVKTYKQLLK